MSQDDNLVLISTICLLPVRIINALITDDMYPCFQPQFAVSHWPSNVDVLEHLVSREGKLHEVYTTLKCTILSHQDSTGKYFDIIKSYKGDVQKSETCFAGEGSHFEFAFSSKLFGVVLGCCELA